MGYKGGGHRDRSMLEKIFTGEGTGPKRGPKRGGVPIQKSVTPSPAKSNSTALKKQRG